MYWVKITLLVSTSPKFLFEIKMIVDGGLLCLVCVTRNHLPLNFSNVLINQYCYMEKFDTVTDHFFVH